MQCIWERRLRYICQKHGVSRKRNVNNKTFQETLVNILGISSSVLGYRLLTEMLAVRYGVNISKENVRKTLRKIDLDGVAMWIKKIIKGRIYLIIFDLITSNP